MRERKRNGKENILPQKCVSSVLWLSFSPVRHQCGPTWALMAYKLIPTASCTASVCGSFFFGRCTSMHSPPVPTAPLPANSFVGRFCMQFLQEGFMLFFCSKRLTGYVLGEDLHLLQCRFGHLEKLLIRSRSFVLCEIKKKHF